MSRLLPCRQPVPFWLLVADEPAGLWHYMHMKTWCCQVTSKKQRSNRKGRSACSNACHYPPPNRGGVCVVMLATGPDHCLVMTEAHTYGYTPHRSLSAKHTPQQQQPQAVTAMTSEAGVRNSSAPTVCPPFPSSLLQQILLVKHLHTRGASVPRLIQGRAPKRPHCCCRPLLHVHRL